MFFKYKKTNAVSFKFFFAFLQRMVYNVELE